MPSIDKILQAGKSGHWTLESAYSLTTTERQYTSMPIFKSKTVEVDPLDAAIDKGRSVRGFLSSMVTDLADANRLHETVKEAENANIVAAQSRIEIAEQEIQLNSALVTNLRNTLGLQD